MTDPRTVRAAGVVLYDASDRIALVHRPRRDDWSLPKGKLERGELHLLAAVRECQEETGQRARLEVPLPSRAYEVAGAPKVVRYWRARVSSDDGFVPGDEVDELRWVRADDAAALLTYDSDADLVARSEALGPTSALILLRHAEAMKRAAWHAEAPGFTDAARPLTSRGLQQASALAGVLAAYDVTRILTSPSRRCRQTVAQYADDAGLDPELEPALSEEGHDADPAATRSAVRDAASAPDRLVLCTHRPVLGTALRTIADALRERGGPLPALDAGLEPAEALVLHRRPDGRVVAVERHTG